MKDNLTPPMIVAWFRTQAKRFNQIADELESTFAAVTVPKLKTDLSNGAGLAVDGNIDAEILRRAVKMRGHRVNDLAARFKSTPDDIIRIISTPGSGLRIVDRGWVKAIEPEQKIL